MNNINKGNLLKWLEGELENECWGERIDLYEEIIKKIEEGVFDQTEG
jgi:hypothetical protein